MSNRLTLLMIMMLLICTSFSSGCQFFNQQSTSEEEMLEEGEEEEVESEEAELFGTGPKPVIENYRPISVKMPDGVVIKGTLYSPGLSPYNPEMEAEEE